MLRAASRQSAASRRAVSESNRGSVARGAPNPWRMPLTSAVQPSANSVTSTRSAQRRLHLPSAAGRAPFRGELRPQGGAGCSQQEERGRFEATEEPKRSCGRGHRTRPGSAPPKGVEAVPRPRPLRPSRGRRQWPPTAAGARGSRRGRRALCPDVRTHAWHKSEPPGGGKAPRLQSRQARGKPGSSGAPEPRGVPGRLRANRASGGRVIGWGRGDGRPKLPRAAQADGAAQPRLPAQRGDGGRSGLPACGSRRSRATGEGRALARSPRVALATEEGTTSMAWSGPPRRAVVRGVVRLLVGGRYTENNFSDDRDDHPPK